MVVWPEQIVPLVAAIATVGVGFTVILYCAVAVQFPAVLIPVTVITVLVFGAMLMVFPVLPVLQL